LDKQTYLSKFGHV